MPAAVGIDLGTTFSAVAVMRPSTGPEVLRNKEDEIITPSVVFFSDGGEALVGTQAKNMAKTSKDVVQFVKRYMGLPDWRFYTTFGKEYRAEEISALILKRLKEDAEQALGEPITDAVITVPAYFGEAERMATRQAAQMAGLNAVRLLNEPTAAALAFGQNESSEGVTLVYDLGGGTFDVTVMRKDGQEITVLATSGNRLLGGFDFDNALMNYVTEAISDQGGQVPLEAAGDLREKCETAKRALTTTARTKIMMGIDGTMYQVPVSREDFERVTAHLLDETRDKTERVLADAGIGWTEVDHFLLVGGSTLMPMVPHMAEQLWGKPIERKVRPNEAVALGASIQAAMTQVGGDDPDPADGGTTRTALLSLFGGEMPSVGDVTSQGLGIVATDIATNQEVNSVIIEPNTRIPIAGGRSKNYQTAAANQTSIQLRVTQGNSEDLQLAKVIGESTVAIPPYPKGAPIRVTFNYDPDQTIDIEAYDLTADKSLGHFEIDRVANLSASELGESTALVASIDVL